MDHAKYVRFRIEMILEATVALNIMQLMQIHQSCLKPDFLDAEEGFKEGEGEEEKTEAAENGEKAKEEEGEDAEEPEGEEEEEPSNLQLAWEMLELAKVY